MLFKDIHNQDRVKRILHGAIVNNRIANAYLFVGSYEDVLRETAIAFAKAVNCDKGDPGACSRCASCQKIDAGVHPDVITISSEGSYIKIDQIRDLKQFIRYGPTYGRRLFIIINKADALTDEAANSFLKSLEEPPPHVTFILLTLREDALPLTIISRCQRIVFAESRDAWKEVSSMKPLYENLNVIQNKSISELLAFSKNLKERSEDIEEILNEILYYFWNLKSIKATKITLDILKGIKKKANLSLALDILCLRLSEVYGKKTSN